ncbi:glycosyltransferase [Luedemannella flava]
MHTLALAEALAAAGQDVTVWTLGRGGDTGFYRPVDPAVRLRIVPFPDGPTGETVGERVLRSIATLRAAFDPGPYDVVHAQDCISANAVGACAHRAPPRPVHHPELAECHERGDRHAVRPCLCRRPSRVSFSTAGG